MIKKTLYFGNPAYLSLRNGQLVIRRPDSEQTDDANRASKPPGETTRPVEDIGVVVLDHPQITITAGAVGALLEQGCAVVTCDRRRMPVGLLLPLCGNTTQNERFRHQLNASLPLRKQLWQQTIQAKINNQAAVLSACTGVETKCMRAWASDVRSGDPDNLEARAAAYYWKSFFPDIPGFTRDREGMPPNHLLNYGYAILRAVVARGLVGSGLLPTLGIHHHNRYNAFQICKEQGADVPLDRNVKATLLTVPTLDVTIGGRRSPLMVAVGQTTASLYKCFAGELRRIAYPEL